MIIEITETALSNPEMVKVILGVLQGKGIIPQHAMRDYLLFVEFTELTREGMKAKEAYPILEQRTCQRGEPLGVRRIEEIIIEFKHRNPELLKNGGRAEKEKTETTPHST